MEKEKWKVAFVSTGEDFGESIHMVPFQFDLIQLLPKCQQVELFFLTFSTGTCVLAVHSYYTSAVECLDKKKMCLRPLACFSRLGREQRARPRLPLPAQRHPAQPLPQQPGAGAQRQGDPAGHQRSRRLHAPHLRARARRPRRSVLPAAH